MANSPSAAFLCLRTFIAERMRMSHIYLSAIDAHGTARPPQPGPSAGHRPADPGKRMVGKVLTGNGITAYGDGRYSLIGGDELSDAERDELQQLCRQRLDAFREQRGEEVYCCAEAFGYVHRSRYQTPITSSRVSATAVSGWVSPGSTS